MLPVPIPRNAVSSIVRMETVHLSNTKEVRNQLPISESEKRMTSSDTHKSSHSSGSNTDSSSKMLGAVLTSLVALYVGMNRFNMTFYLMEQSSGAGSGGTGSASQPMACCGILVVLAIRKVWNDRVGSMVENCSHKVDTVMMRVSSNKTLTRIKSSSMRLLDLATGRHEGGDGYEFDGESTNTQTFDTHGTIRFIGNDCRVIIDRYQRFVPIRTRNESNEF